MSDNTLGNSKCYICGRWMPPLVSSCPGCGYSQLPGPDSEAPDAPESETPSVRDRLKSQIEEAKAKALKPPRKP